MASEERPSPIFVADAVGLDFLNSIATPVDVPVEWLASGEDLLAWLEQAGLLTRAVLSSLRKSALPGELDAVATQARALREWFRGFVREHKGRPLDGRALGALDPLNRVLARDEAFGQIVVREEADEQGEDVRGARRSGAAAGRLKWQWQRLWRSPESLLLPIAQAIAELICDEDFTYVKACEGPTCTLLFADHTRHHSRRWCSMAVCGNRAKQAAHRGRARRAQK